MMISRTTGGPIDMEDVVALIRKEGYTRVYLRSHREDTVTPTPRSIARQRALLGQLLSGKTALAPHHSTVD